ncbi:MAG: M15 family metallopeptidase [Byssovorax sp.]
MRSSPTASRAAPASRRLSRALTAAALGLIGLGAWDLGGEPSAEAKEHAPKGGKGAFENGCRVQQPQRFLERRSFLTGGIVDAAKHAVAVRYMAEHYGNVGDDVTPKYSKKSAPAQAKTVRFFGLPLVVHEKIAPAVACVEKRIAKTCTGRSSYTPHVVGGLRTSNTYRGVEISNHLFGAAIDIDPDRNPCCGCVDPWPSNPLCKREGTVWKRTALPQCWVKSFERYGFDWLGHDKLEDTMHFEFLGDPDRITR